MSITIAQLLKNAQQQLASISDSPKADAEYLLAHVLQKPRGFLTAFSEQLLSSDEQQHFNELLSRRLTGEPVAYVIGNQGFWNLLLTTNNTTLIPRPETETLVEAVLALDSVQRREALKNVTSAAKARQKFVRNRSLQVVNEDSEQIFNDAFASAVVIQRFPKTVLDLGVGTGAIVLALAHEKPHWQLFGSDVSAEALAVAKKNSEALGLKNVELRQGSWCEPWQDKLDFFDVVVSNPPYICEGDAHLTQGDVRFEPRLALVSGADGLRAIREIVKETRTLIKKNGWLLIEHGFDQGQNVRDIFKQNGFTNIETLNDLSGHNRVCKGQHK